MAPWMDDKELEEERLTTESYQIKATKIANLSDAKQ